MKIYWSVFWIPPNSHKKIKAVYDSDPVKYETLQQILFIEKSTYGSEWPKVGATLALMWLKR